MQIAISNPNREVLKILSRAGVVEMIGKEWYFVRVHDAVQVCLQHVQGLKETPSNSATAENQSHFQRLLRQRLDDSSIDDLESGAVGTVDPHLEPLLSKRN